MARVRQSRSGGSADCGPPCGTPGRRCSGGIHFSSRSRCNPAPGRSRAGSAAPCFVHRAPPVPGWRPAAGLRKRRGAAAGSCPPGAPGAGCRRRCGWASAGGHTAHPLRRGGCGASSPARGWPSPAAPWPAPAGPERSPGRGRSSGRLPVVCSWGRVLRPPPPAAGGAARRTPPSACRARYALCPGGRPASCAGAGAGSCRCAWTPRRLHHTAARSGSGSGPPAAA